jgi:hypothetical protein
MLETGNKGHMANMSAPVFARKAPTPSTPISDVARATRGRRPTRATIIQYSFTSRE